MSGEKRRRLSYPVRRVFLLLLGLWIMAVGIALSIQAELGTTPISSVPYALSLISGVSVGTTTILVNTVLILLQIVILRRRFDWFQLLQFPAVLLFGTMIDLAGLLVDPIPVPNYFMQWVLCALGIFCVALGVSVEVEAGLVTTPGEGVVLSICQVAPVKFGNIKVSVDVSLVCISILLSLIFLGQLAGVREGTLAAAVCVGLITKRTNKLLDRIGTVILK